jgi:Uma2 family endonuclease
MIETMTAELDVPIKSGGSTTFKRRDLEKGIEPDECYWVQHEAAVRNKEEIDLLSDPAPDLVVESEVTRSLLDRLGILAALGVGEAWRYDGERLRILVRGDDGRLEEQARSRCFPWLPIEPFADWLRKVAGIGETTWIRGFQRWVRETLS